MWRCTLRDSTSCLAPSKKGFRHIPSCFAENGYQMCTLACAPSWQPCSPALCMRYLFYSDSTLITILQQAMHLLSCCAQNEKTTFKRTLLYSLYFRSLCMHCCLWLTFGQSSY